MKRFIALFAGLASLALFVALFAPKVNALSCNNCVSGGDIINGAIKSADIANNSVKATDLAANSVGTSEIKTNGVGNAELIDDLTVSSLSATTLNSSVLNLSSYIHLNSGSVTISDNGNGSAASISFVPTNLYITVDCQDADGCTLLLDPSDEAEDGFIAIVINESASSNVTLPHAAGQYAIDGGADRVLGPGDTSTLISEMTYGLWLETSHTNTTIPE